MTEDSVIEGNKIIKGKWIYWRWKEGNHKTWSKSFVQNIDGFMLELTDHEFHSSYPTRVQYGDIEILPVKKQQH